MKIDDEAARTKYNYCARLYHRGFGHVAICEVSACYFFRPEAVDERPIIFVSSSLVACIFHLRWLNNVRKAVRRWALSVI